MQQTSPQPTARFRRRPQESPGNPSSTASVGAWKKQSHSNFLLGGHNYDGKGGTRRSKAKRLLQWQRMLGSVPRPLQTLALIMVGFLVMLMSWSLLQYAASFFSWSGTIHRGEALLIQPHSAETRSKLKALSKVHRKRPKGSRTSFLAPYLQQMDYDFYHRLDSIHDKSGQSQSRTLQNYDTLATSSQCPSTPAQDVTLVTQTTIDRLPMLRQFCLRWKSSPIVVAVALLDPSTRKNLLAQYEEACNGNVSWIVYHLTESTSNYPINALRNLAFDAVKTSHVLMIDIDFVPSMGLDDTLRSLLNDEDRAVVVPAFERICKANDQDCTRNIENDPTFLPSDMAGLRQCVQDYSCQVFQADNNPEGHATTRAIEWLDQKEGNSAFRTIPCFDSLRYEPYLVLPWCGGGDSPRSPYYDERFHGYGKNKIQHVQHVRFLGFSFEVLPTQGFLMHAPHLESSIKREWNDQEDSPLHQEMDQLYVTFMRELVQKYFVKQQQKDRHVIQQCK